MELSDPKPYKKRERNLNRISISKKTAIFLNLTGLQCSIFRVSRESNSSNNNNHNANSANNPTEWMLWSCAHSLYPNSNEALRKQKLYILVNNASDTIATHDDKFFEEHQRAAWEMLEIGSLLYARLDSIVDFSVWTLNVVVDVHPDLQWNGVLKPALSKPVFKIGSVSGRTNGTIAQYCYSELISLHGERHLVERQLKIQVDEQSVVALEDSKTKGCFSVPGDSGSDVACSNNCQSYGCIRAGVGGITIAAPTQYIFNSFNNCKDALSKKSKDEILVQLCPRVIVFHPEEGLSPHPEEGQRLSDPDDSIRGIERNKKELLIQNEGKQEQ